MTGAVGSSGRQRVASADFPSRPGVYVVWDERDPFPLYVGVAATQTIADRWHKQTLQDRAGGSALRRSLGPYLKLVERKLSPSRDGRYYQPDVEREITRYLRACEIEFHPCRDAEDARTLEQQLISELHPRLNLQRPRIKRTPSEKAVLADARTLFRDGIKPALTTGLRAIAGDVRLDPANNYLVDVADNLLPGITRAQIEPDFKNAPGRELESKMRAPWSSSALAVNSFARWREDPSLLPLAGRSGFAPGFHFEFPAPNDVSRLVPPTLDVVFRRPGEVVAVESKFTEYLQGSDHPPVSASYKTLGDAGDTRAGSRWFAALAEVERFLLLDAYQLVKHYLGLVKTFDGEKCVLIYLYWEPANAADGPAAGLITQHRNEVARFAELVDGDPTCAFVHLSYPDHWRELRQLETKPPWLDDHLRLLERRYLVSI